MPLLLIRCRFHFFVTLKILKFMKFNHFERERERDRERDTDRERESESEREREWKEREREI